MFQKFFISLFLILGLSLIVFNKTVIKYVENYLFGKDPRPVVAQVTKSEGQSRYLLPKTLKFREAPQGQTLRNGDRFLTDESTNAEIKFNNGLELEILPNSLIVIEEPKRSESGAFIITFLRGDFKVLNKGNQSITIQKKKKASQDKSALNVSVIKKPPQKVELKKEVETFEPIKKTKTTFKKKKKDPKPKETLSDRYISKIINSQKPFFKRCYAQHRKLNPESEGRVEVNFTITPSGAVENAQVIGSTITDELLQDCTLSVMERCRFKKFDGPPIVVNYPINFE